MSSRDALADLSTYLRLHAILDSLLEIESLLAETDCSSIATHAESFAVEMRELMRRLLEFRLGDRGDQTRLLN